MENGALGHLSKQDMKALQNSPRCCIYKVPKIFRVAGGDRYDPRVVPIGPYHKVTTTTLEVTEKHKQYYLSFFIDENNTPDSAKKTMIDKIKDIEDDALSHYAENYTFKKDKFRDMLILDGCFIIGVLYRYNLPKHHPWRENDILFNNKSVISSIRRDLVLLENQIPYSVLEVLFEIITAPPNPLIDPEITTLKQLIMNFFSPILPATISQATLNSVRKGKNILDLLRQHLIFPEVEGQNEVGPAGIITENPRSGGEDDGREAGINEVTEVPRSVDTILHVHDGEETRRHGKDEARDGVKKEAREADKAGITKISCFNCQKEEKVLKWFSNIWQHTTCATDLEEAGVKFREKNPNKGLLDITFDPKEGKFEIPPFYFGESWTVLFPNMIALEQCHGALEDRITSYVHLIDNLVDSRSDVKVLYDQKIIVRMSKEFETIASDINNLCKEAIYETFYYDEMCEEVNKYRNEWHHKWRANFMRNYWHTPWASVSISAAVLLLVLAIAQTILSALAWRLPVK